MTAQPVPISRQPACPSCRHEWHLLACSEACSCSGSTPLGVYTTPWHVYVDEPRD